MAGPNISHISCLNNGTLKVRRQWQWLPQCREPQQKCVIEVVVAVAGSEIVVLDTVVSRTSSRPDIRRGSW